MLPLLECIVWIPVETALPLDGKAVLVKTPGNKCYWMAQYIAEEGVWHDWATRSCGQKFKDPEDITHWASIHGDRE